MGANQIAAIYQLTSRTYVSMVWTAVDFIVSYKYSE